MLLDSDIRLNETFVNPSLCATNPMSIIITLLWERWFDYCNCEFL